MSGTQTSPQNANPQLPLFYQKPEPLNANLHAGWKLDTKQDFHFARQTNAAPIMRAEFMQASRFYPIVFAGEHMLPVAVLGIQQENLFVEENGEWSTGTYVPAYIRRHPFIFIETPDKANMILGIDMASNRLVREGAGEANSQPLFADGKPAALTQDALRFCGELQGEHLATKEFSSALVSHDLLIERRADARLPDGKSFNLQGFKIVDAEKFRMLPDEVVVDWHRKGWLGLVHFHLAAFDRWQDLLNRAAARSTSPETAQ